MSVEENKAIVRRFLDALNNRDVDEFDNLFVEDYVLYDPGSPGGIVRGLDAIKDHTMMLVNALPDFHSTLEEMFAEDDKVVGRFTHRGTHLRDFMGIPASGNKVAVEAINIYRVANGKLVEAWGEVDTIGLLRQLGLMPG
jgi:steroid delta-isomerase-like uncharacterized protein